MLEPGQAFGRYVVEELVGEGGMGQVYRARDTVLHRRVALKLLVDRHGDAAAWTEARARMVREARAAAALQHPNAVAIYDVGTEGDTPYIAMELVPGQSLRAYVGDAAVPWERKLRWLLDVAEALAAAHDEGLVHRDVKPENVVVRPDGRVKVLDFGIARRAAISPTSATSGGEATSTLTGGGTVLGTPRYMPPEQIAGRALDGRADQFAWGVTAYELLSGANPWPEKTDALATAAAILTEPAPALMTVAPELPLSVTQAIDRTLAKRPEDRFASMLELVAALDPDAAPHVSSALSSNPLPMSKPSGRVVDPFAETQARQETGKAVAADRGTTTRPRRRGRSWVLPAAGVAVALAAAAGLVVRTRSAVVATATTATPSASASAPRALTLLDLPRPGSSSAEALTLYASALQALHDGSSSVATGRLLGAVAKDPSLGPAHIRYAVEAYFPASDEPRKHFNQAVALRAAMSPYDQALLDSVEPIFDRQPPEWAEAARRTADATRRLPEDPEFFETLSWLLQQVGDFEGATRAADAALALDPSYAQALYQKAAAALTGSDWTTARQTADRCLAVSPQATSCIRERMFEEAWSGRCAEYGEDARRNIAINPEGWAGYASLAEASFVLGKPRETVREALEQDWKRLDGDDRDWQVGNQVLTLAVLEGDAHGLQTGLAAMQKFAQSRSEALYHMIPAWMGVLSETEAGHLDRAANAADDYLGRLEAWTADQGIDLFSVSYDMRPFMRKALVRAGRISQAEYAQRRQEWLDGWRARVSPAVVRYLWVYGYAMQVDTPEDAKEALEVLPAYMPLPEFSPSLHATADIGHALLLGGRIDEAAQWLRASSRDCDAFENPYAWVHASLWLGQALEQKGDAAGACSAYGAVARMWSPFGKASTSAALARKRMAVLACKG
jgi:tetratricopeptide (TPR) repeat protein